MKDHQCYSPETHLLSTAQIKALPDDRVRVLVSACLAGQVTTWDAQPLGMLPILEHFLALPQVEKCTFCPEEYSFGTPREMSNCYGGNGFDVLDGRAKILTDTGVDWTEGMVRAAHAMAARAAEQKVDLAILLNISAACGTQTIYDGHRDDKNYQRGPGVAAAALIRAGIPVLSNRDLKTMAALVKRYDPSFEAPEGLIDLHEHPWYKETFGA
ncbi:MAG: DUF523 domain-containing protein [Planctomycetes bacterium]|nr:DUF523 domain-containing protein [Planctomycetota bacterium]